MDEVIGSMYAERAFFAQQMDAFLWGAAQLMGQLVLEGLISYLPGGVYVLAGYHLIHAYDDIKKNGLNDWNSFELVTSAIPLGGALLRGFTRHLDDLSRLRPPRARASGIAPCPILRHVCFAGGTPVLMADGSTAPIEDVGIGAVVWSAPDPTLPAGWVAGDPTSPDAYTTIDTATWRRVTLRVVDGPQAQMHIELLRPPAWFEAVAPVPGGTVQFDFPELRLATTAQVVAIGPCPDIPAMYDGSIVTGRFVTERAPVLALTVIGQEEPVRVTARHPFFSADRGGWVAAGDLRPSERVRTQGGYATIGAITPCTATETVYNLEIHRHHTLYVSGATLWAHNTCTKAQVRDIARWWKLDGPRVHPKLGRTSHGQEWFTDGSKWYTFDVDGHRGGIWKVFDRNGNRLCTVDIDGRIVGK